MNFTLAKLNSLLNKSGLDDAAIARGVRLRPSGFEKLGRVMNVSPEEVMSLLDDLIRELRRSDLVEASSRYGYEKDQLGNLTIRDTHTDQSLFIRGATALALLNKLQNGDAQQVLADYFRSVPLNEAANDKGGDSYAAEIRSDVGSFNFPWKYNGKTGFGTASYKGYGDNFTLKLISIRDTNGEDIDFDGRMKEDVTSQAYEFISEA